jgi:hypothetical protein
MNASGTFKAGRRPSALTSSCEAPSNFSKVPYDLKTNLENDIELYEKNKKKNATHYFPTYDSSPHSSNHVAGQRPMTHGPHVCGSTNHLPGQLPMTDSPHVCGSTDHVPGQKPVTVEPVASWDSQLGSTNHVTVEPAEGWEHKPRDCWANSGVGAQTT